MTERELKSEPEETAIPDGCHRREFLKIGGAAAAAVVLGACGARVHRGTFPVGDPLGIEVGSVTLVEEGPFFVIRDEDGLYAMSARCTHMGCQLNQGADSLDCRCHGSTFDLDGRATHGPASTPLEHYLVTVGAGGVTVDTSQTVAADARVPVEGASASD
jgi:Rieske Fe-S protein